MIRIIEKNCILIIKHGSCFLKSYSIMFCRVSISFFINSFKLYIYHNYMIIISELFVNRNSTHSIEYKKAALEMQAFPGDFIYILRTALLFTTRKSFRLVNRL